MNIKVGKHIVTIDKEDYKQIRSYPLSVLNAHSDLKYAQLAIDGKRVLLHRFLLGISDGREIDHIDGNGLNNQKNNLRTCTHAQNMKNRKIGVNNSSGFKGVHPAGKKYCIKVWRSDIQVDGVKKYLGHYERKEDAARAYNEAAIRYFGEYASLNVLT